MLGLLTVFIPELLGGKISPIKILKLSPWNAEVCDKLYLKYKISLSKFVSSPPILFS